MSDPVNRPPDIHLHPGKEKGLLRGHPWVFSGAIQRMEVDAAPPSAGDWVRVFSSEGHALGWGHWGEGSIAVRILADGNRPLPPDASWWTEKLGQALLIRRAVGFKTDVSDGENDCFRWIHGEGDGLSGLVVDLYGSVAVVQTHTMGMHRAWSDLESALRSVLGERLNAIVNKSANLLQKLPKAQQIGNPDGVIWSRKEDQQEVRQEVYEHGIQYVVDPLGGSWFVERLTDEMYNQVRTLIEEVEQRGGALAAIEQGWPQQQIHASAYRYLNEIEHNQRRIVGVNHGVMDEHQTIPVMKVDPSLGERQTERLAALRASRDAARVAEALDAVRTAAGSDTNLFPPVIQAVRARATLGEIIGVMKDEFGTYMAPSGF